MLSNFGSYLAYIYVTLVAVVVPLEKSSKNYGNRFIKIVLCIEA